MFNSGTKKSEFKRFSEDLDETVFALGGSLHYERPRYRSRFATKVRVDKWCQKSGCFRTIGPPKIYSNPPELFLKKHSRYGPVFFSPEDLKKTPKAPGPKTFKDKTVVRNEPESDPRSTNYKTNKPPVLKPCKYPPPLQDTGLFRSNGELAYEKRFRPRVFEKCCENAHPDSFCPCLSEEDSSKNPKNPKNVKSRVGYNGPVHKIDRGQRDFLKENALKIIRTPARRTIGCYMDESGNHTIDQRNKPFVLKSGFGQVPKYIQKRKWELYYEALALKREMEGQGGQGQQQQFQPNCRVVSETERQLILDGLTGHWNELNNIYCRLPAHQSDKVDREKEELEEKLSEIEKDIKLFYSSENIIVSDLVEPLNPQDIQ